MITSYDLMVIKEEMNHDKIIHLIVSNKDFVFRLITVKEYTQARMLTSTPEEFNDAVCQIALIYPEDYNFSISPIAGASDIAGGYIIKESKIFDNKAVLDVLENSRAKLGRFYDQCVLMIKAAFSEYTLEEIENWNYDKLMDMVAKSEYVLNLRGDFKREYKIECEIEECNEGDITYTDAELISSDTDPMFYYADKIKLKKDFIDKPVILGNNWGEEELINDVREQILKRRIS